MFPADRGPTELHAGDLLGGYRIDRLIGRGGMGSVFLGFDTTLHRSVALKLLDSTEGPGARQRLIREARNAAALNHPNICTVHEVSEDQGLAFISMEFVDGQPLSERLAGPPLPLSDVIGISTQVADALAHAHARGVVHRDFKSANVMLDSGGRVKIVDFGLARRSDALALDTSTVATVAASGIAAGTPYAMAPEQVRGENADARTDVWAFGVLLHEMVTQTQPFRAASIGELFSSILRDDPAPVPAHVPPGIRTVIARCLEKDPVGRYQNAAEVKAALEQLASASRSQDTAGRRLPPRAFVAAALVVVLTGLVGLGVWVMRDRFASSSSALRFDSVAVLPLENMTGDKDGEYLTVGLQDALITELAKLPGMRKVISRRSLRGDATARTPAQLASMLDVRAIVTGSMFKAGDGFRVAVQLIEPATGQHIWGDQYERSGSDLLKLQGDIVAAIARAIGSEFSPDDHRRLAGVRQVDPETYADYLRGMFHLNRGQPGDVRSGLQFLERAVERDPGNPEAYAGLALGYATIGHGPNSTPDLWTRARAAATRAVTLDPMLAEAHAAVADVKLYFERDWEGAERAFRRANELNPGLAMNHYHYSWYLTLFSRWDEAIAEHKRAQELDPLTPMHTAWLAAVYGFAGRIDEAVATARKATELNEKAPAGWVALAFSLADQKNYQEAMAAAERAGAINPVWKYVLGCVYAMAGRRDDAMKIIAELEATKATAIDALHFAQLQAALGNRDEAFRWLAFEPAHGTLPWVRVDPGYLSLRGDPRFTALLRRLNLPDP